MKVRVELAEEIIDDDIFFNFDHNKYSVIREIGKFVFRDAIYEHDRGWLNLYQRSYYKSKDACIAALPR